MNLKEIIYKKLKFKKDRFFLFTYLSEGLRNGSSISELLETISISYKDSNKYLYKYISDILYYMEELGMSEPEAFKEAGVISNEEFFAIEQIFYSEPYKALEYLNTKTSSEDNLKWAIGMLFFPTILVLIMFLIFQPELKDFTEQMLEPINSMSKKHIDIPEWFKDRTIFGTYLFALISFITALFLYINYLKKNNIKLLFKLFKIKEREFILNNFEIILSLMKSGQSLMRSIEIISEQKNDPVSYKIFSEIKDSMKEGDKFMYEVLNEYGIDSATISYLMSGQKNNTLIKAIESVVNYNKSRYDKLIEKLTKYMPLTGEIAMTLILLLPLIDIINVTTIGALNFEV